MRTQEEIKKDIAKLKEELREVQEVDKGIAEGDVRAIAIFIHDKKCTSDHAAECSWFYEIKNGYHDWSKSAHKHWLERAQRFVDKWGIDDIGTKLEMALDL